MKMGLDDFLDPERDTIDESQFKPAWFIVKEVGNNSRDVVAAFSGDHEEEACVFVEAVGDKMNERYYVIRK